MIVICRACGTRYELADAQVPARIFRVKCPRCRGVFRLDGTAAGVAAGRRSEAGPDEVIDLAGKVPAPAAAVLETETAGPVPSVPGAAPEAPTPQAPPHDEADHERARRLARALAADILAYNRERRDEALRRGRLLVDLAPEIHEAWDFYKREVGSDLARTTPYFREALGEVLGDGRPLIAIKGA